MKRRRGAALLFVIIAVVIVGALATAFLASQTTSIGIAANISDHSRSRFIAEAGLARAITFIRSTDDWRSTKPDGTWVVDESYGDGTFSIDGEDGVDSDGDGTVDGDGDLNDDPFDPVTLTVTGKYGGSSHVVRAVARPCPASIVVFEEFTEAKASSGTPSINLSTPPGTQAGDLLIAAVVTDGNETLASPGGEGWREVSVNASGSVTLGVWWKNAGSSESSSHRFTWGSYEESYAWMMRFSGHDQDSPINAVAVNGGTSDAPQCSDVTTTVARSRVLCIGGFDDGSINVDNTGLTGHTDVTMDRSSTNLGACSGGAGHTCRPEAGTDSAVAFSINSAEQWRTVTLALTPDPNGCGDGTICGEAPSLDQLAQWKLDELSGTTAEDSVGSHNGTYQNGVLLGRDPHPNASPDTHSAFFDGSNDQMIAGPAAALRLDRSMAISLWVNPSSLPSDLREPIAVITAPSNGRRRPPARMFELSIESDGDLYYAHDYNGGSKSHTFQPANLLQNNWYHLVLTRDTSNNSVSIFLDGSLLETWSYNGSDPKGRDSGTFYLGRFSSVQYHGLLDDVNLFDRTLTAEEVQALYANSQGSAGDAGYSYAVQWQTGL